MGGLDLEFGRLNVRRRGEGGTSTSDNLYSTRLFKKGKSFWYQFSIRLNFILRAEIIRIITPARISQCIGGDPKGNCHVQRLFLALHGQPGNPVTQRDQSGSTPTTSLPTIKTRGLSGFSARMLKNGTACGVHSKAHKTAPCSFNCLCGCQCIRRVRPGQAGFCSQGSFSQFGMVRGGGNATQM